MNKTTLKITTTERDLAQNPWWSQEYITTEVVLNIIHDQ